MVDVAAWVKVDLNHGVRVNSVKVLDQLFVNGAHHAYTVSNVALTRLVSETIGVTTAFNTITVIVGCTWHVPFNIETSASYFHNALVLFLVYIFPFVFWEE